jgi:DNA-directed RNA polymerase subunit N (RpoN/RPB10)
MLPPVCFTCGKLFADFHSLYENDMATIENDIKLTDNEKTELKSKLLDKYHITRYCCRMRVLGYVRLVDIIL